jgi:hypothetical protein
MRLVLGLALAALLAGSAMAQTNGKQGSLRRCWAQTDPRGYGFWDECRDPKEAQREEEHHGYRMHFPQPRSGAYDNSSVANGGGGGGGGK